MKMQRFLQSLSLEDALIVLQDILEDDKVKQEENRLKQNLLSFSALTSMVDSARLMEEITNENSPVFWRSKLINLLRNNALNYDESEKKFRNAENTSTDLIISASPGTKRIFSKKTRRRSIRRAS
jgi:hypothetical protein